MWRFGGSVEPPQHVTLPEIHKARPECSSPTFVPLFRDISGESSVHSVGEDVAVNYPDPPRRRFRQQLQNRDNKRRLVQTRVVKAGKKTPSELLSLPSALE